jgi:predicted negative regulator of RcsB-dependent stress response
MAYDLEEQEQIATIKAWWEKWGKLITTGVTAVLVGIAGVQGWRHYSSSQAAGASMLYSQLDTADKSNEPKKVHEIATTLVTSHARTPYASMAALRSAKLAAGANDLASARTRLQWVVDNTRDEDMRDIARLRLAGIAFDEKKPDEALKLLDAKHGSAFDGLYADLKGDVLAAQGKRAEARAAYQIAFDKAEARGQYRQIVQAKLDATGEAPKADGKPVEKAVDKGAAGK